ncbi:MAG: hypothetical protein ABIQ15_13185 [Nocardioides sp.]
MDSITLVVDGRLLLLALPVMLLGGERFQSWLRHLGYLVATSAGPVRIGVSR